MEDVSEDTKSQLDENFKKGVLHFLGLVVEICSAISDSQVIEYLFICFRLNNWDNFEEVIGVVRGRRFGEGSYPISHEESPRRRNRNPWSPVVVLLESNIWRQTQVGEMFDFIGIGGKRSVAWFVA